MASASPAMIATAKSSTSVPQQAPPSHSHGLSPSGGGDRQRRHGASAHGLSIRPLSSLRNNQSLRKQHRLRKPRLEDDEGLAEAAAIRSTGSRKGQTSITHLMNFALPPRPTSCQAGMFHHQSVRPTPGHSRVDKARYVPANYRFVITPSSGFHTDVDNDINWDEVLQVLASLRYQVTSCPFCLSVPIAPRMARCGHIFCLPCLIHYMHSTDEGHLINGKRGRWKKCPICWDIIYVSETRPVRWLQDQHDPPQEDADVVLRLMARMPGRRLALPRDYMQNALEDIPWCHTAGVLDYARVMKGDRAYMITQFDREITDITLQEQEDEISFGEGREWTQKAISAIDESKAKLDEVDAAPWIQSHRRNVDPSKHPSRSPGPGAEQPRSTIIQRPAWRRSQDTTKTVGVEFPLPTLRHIAPPAQGVSNSATDSFGNAEHSFASAAPSRSPFYFYQLLPHHYLAPLDIRILRTAFGDYSMFPTTILARVERVSMGHIVDDDLRRRAKYLAHLPLGCEVSFLECDLTEIVPLVVLRQFSGDIERRRKKNHEKQGHEEREKARIEREEEEKKWAITRRKRNSFTRDSAENGDCGWESLATLDATIDVLADQSSSPPRWPSRRGSAFTALATPSTSPDAQTTIWGTPAVAPRLQEDLAHTNEPSQEDGWLQGWENNLQNTPLALSDPERPVTKDAPSRSDAFEGRNRKRKGKKITIMSTNARRAA